MVIGSLWKFRQFGSAIDRFRQRECRSEAWQEVVISLAIVMEKGPHDVGPMVSKKLKAGDGIWEVIASYDNLRPRLFFYVRPNRELMFVHAIMKKGSKDYGPAISLSQARRTAIERGNATIGPFVH